MGPEGGRPPALLFSLLTVSVTVGMMLSLGSGTSVEILVLFAHQDHVFHAAASMPAFRTKLARDGSERGEAKARRASAARLQLIPEREGRKFERRKKERDDSASQLLTAGRTNEESS